MHSRHARLQTEKMVDDSVCIVRNGGKIMQKERIR